MSVLTDGIITKLTTDQTAGSFYDDLSGRISTLQSDQDVDQPKCVINVVTDPPRRFFVSDDIESQVVIDLWGRAVLGYDVLSDINDKLVALLDKQAVTITGFTNGQAYLLDRGVPTVVEDSVRISSQWRIWADAV